MAKKTDNFPSTVLKKLMEDYGLNPSKLGAAINLNQATLRLILLGKGKISCLIALKLARFFGETPEYWLNLQNQYDLAEAAKDKELTAALKSIKKVKKAPPPKKAAKGTEKKEAPKAPKSGKTAADSKKTAAATRKSAADSKKTTKAAAGKAPAAKRTAAKKAAEPKPGGAKRGRKPKSETAVSVPEPDPPFESEPVFESDSVFASDPAFESESAFASESTLESEPASVPQEDETQVRESETFSPFSFPETAESEEVE
ncbi:MAG: HigA family addiction module antidote protein [Treponema sp.]|jgi:addiction module HigA family antidote|nr:HigA family addiction module antidote protein [Treponema sp.]